MAANRGTIGILTGGGDVPGLNPAIRAITIRALREGYRVIGIRRGWAGLVDLVVEAQLAPHDYMAHVPIVQGAGGIVTDWEGASVHVASGTTRIVAAGDPISHAQALEVLTAAA